MEYKKIEDIEYYIAYARFVDRIEAKTYARFETIKARQGKILDIIENKSSDGLIVKRDVVMLDQITKQPDWIITASNGRQIIMKDSKFQKKYKIYDKENGLYISKEIETFIKINENITFTTAWGEEISIKKGGYLNITDPNKVFGVPEEQFHKYYAECDENGRFLSEELNNDIK